MPQTTNDRRRYERERKREQRAADRAAGRPTGAAVNAALAEALALVVNTGVNIEAGKAMIDSGRVAVLAKRILHRRMGYDRELSNVAIVRAVAPRGQHRWPSVIADLERPSDRDAA